MSILNMTQQDNSKDTKEFGDELLGIHNAIKNFVEAKKGEALMEDKGKKKIVKDAIKKNY